MKINGENMQIFITGEKRRNDSVILSLLPLKTSPSFECFFFATHKKSGSLSVTENAENERGTKQILHDPVKLCVSLSIGTTTNTNTRTHVKWKGEK
jgi:hypothetical protein